MSLINSYEKDLLKLNSEKTSILGLIKGLEQIILTYEGNKSKSKNLYQSTYDKYNEVKNKVESLEYELNNEKQTLNTLEKVLNINYNLHVQNEESVRKYHINLESYQKKLQTIEIDILIKEMQKSIIQLEKKRDEL
jgi:chromosome segregation ATPase